MKTTVRTSACVLALLATLGVDAGPAHAGRKVRATLTQTGGDPNATGTASVLVRGEDGRLDVRVQGLDSNATFVVVLDGVAIGMISTTGGGNGGARFRSRPRGHDQLLGADPRGHAISVRDAAGDDVLGADVPDNSPADEVICCVPHDSGPECEDRTAERCAAQGGTAVTATSCIPNPCAGTPLGAGDVVCCIPDDTGPECEDRTEAECAAAGGISLGTAGSCTPNPCTPPTPGDPEVMCCLPNAGGETECEDRTASQCAAEGGVDMGPGTCVPDPC